jgi:hypothetical protein
VTLGSTRRLRGGRIHAASRPGSGEGRLVPTRVEDVPVEAMPAVLRPLVFCDLFGMDAEQAQRVLLAAVAGPRRPDGEPVFPGRAFHWCSLSSATVTIEAGGADTDTHRAIPGPAPS